MAVIEASYTNNINNNEEMQKQKNHEDLNLIPIVHVKDLYRSFDYKNKRNNCSSISISTDHGHVSGQQQQLPAHSTTSERIVNVQKQRRRQVANKYTEMVGLSSKFSESFAYHLSRGMKQRAARVFALAMEPEVLLMDEPFASLDIQIRDLLRKELVGIHETTYKTILSVTHNISEAVFLDDRVIALSSLLKDIKEEFQIDLPRPRDPESSVMHEIK
jgi:ABC-type nitrate/sulfonate/bicarbonate transport system ATPase subunit